MRIMRNDFFELLRECLALDFVLLSNFKNMDIIICTFNMKVEILNTILSSLPPYQKNVVDNLDSITIVDNGSTDGIKPENITELADNIQFVRYPSPTRSPAPALNWAVRNFATSDHIMLCIDGARMFSDHLISRTMEVFKYVPNAFVYTLSFHIGRKAHQELARDGYTLEDFRQFLDDLDWQNDPGSLRENSVLALSSRKGYDSAIAESNAFCLRRTDFERLGGFDERFLTPGGGLCNLEIFQRCTSDSSMVNVCLLGEGTYHQYHGGAATGLKIDQKTYQVEYKSIFGVPFQVRDYARFYY